MPVTVRDYFYALGRAADNTLYLANTKEKRAL